MRVWNKIKSTLESRLKRPTRLILTCSNRLSRSLGPPKSFKSRWPATTRRTMVWSIMLKFRSKRSISSKTNYYTIKSSYGRKNRGLPASNRSLLKPSASKNGRLDQWAFHEPTLRTPRVPCQPLEPQLIRLTNQPWLIKREPENIQGPTQRRH